MRHEVVFVLLLCLRLLQIRMRVQQLKLDRSNKLIAKARIINKNCIFAVSFTEGSAPTMLKFLAQLVIVAQGKVLEGLQVIKYS